MDIANKVKTAAWIGCLMGSFVLWPGASQATVITTGCAGSGSCTLAELLAGGTMEVNNGYADLLFQNFLQESLLTSATVPDYNLITVTGLDVGDAGFVIAANGQLVVTDTDFLSLRLGFKVVDLTGTHLKDNDLLIDGFVLGTGHVKVDENVFDSGGIYLGSKHTEIDPLWGVDVRHDHLDFVKVHDLIIEKDILLEGRALGDVAGLLIIEQRFSVPEPATTFLVGAGLAGFWLGRRNAAKV